MQFLHPLYLCVSASLDGKLYDAYISYVNNDYDRKFVNFILKPHLENKSGYKLHLNDNDILPGAGNITSREYVSINVFYIFVHVICIHSLFLLASSIQHEYSFFISCNV